MYRSLKSKPSHQQLNVRLKDYTREIQAIFRVKQQCVIRASYLTIWIMILSKKNAENNNLMKNNEKNTERHAFNFD